MSFQRPSIDTSGAATAAAALGPMANACTFTLQLPAGAQTSPPGERPFGSLAKIELAAADGAERSPKARPVLGDSVSPLLTLTF